MVTNAASYCLCCLLRTTNQTGCTTSSTLLCSRDWLSFIVAPGTCRPQDQWNLPTHLCPLSQRPCFVPKPNRPAYFGTRRRRISTGPSRKHRRATLEISRSPPLRRMDSEVQALSLTSSATTTTVPRQMSKVASTNAVEK